jgi:hypothetical protein
VIRYLGPGVEVGEVVADAIARGRGVRVVHAGATIAETLDAFARELDFPAWFGANLDALADSLDDVAARTHGDRELVIDGAAALARADPRAMADLRSIFGEVTRAHPRFHITVLDHGE